MTDEQNLKRWLSWSDGRYPDTVVGDVIAAEQDGTIVLDDGLTTWNPLRACAFLIAIRSQLNTELQQLRATLAERDRELLHKGEIQRELEKQQDRNRNQIAELQSELATAHKNHAELQQSLYELQLNILGREVPNAASVITLEWHSLRSQLQAATARAEEAEKLWNEDGDNAEHYRKQLFSAKSQLLALQAHVVELRKALQLVDATNERAYTAAMRLLAFQPELGLIEEVRERIVALKNSQRYNHKGQLDCHGQYLSACAIEYAVDQLLTRLGGK